MRYAAYDNVAIYGVGDTKQGALKESMAGCGADPAGLTVHPIEEGFAQDISDNGFDPHRQGFDLVDGVIVEV